VFVRPVLRKMVGVSKLHRPTERAVLTQGVQSTAGMRQFARGRLHPTLEGTFLVDPLGTRDAPHLTDLARANALVVVPESVPAVAAGEEVDCLLLERRRG
jgi:molybdopterin molybdotransferase